MDIKTIKYGLLDLQNRLCASFETMEQQTTGERTRFLVDEWQRDDLIENAGDEASTVITGGGGMTAVLRGGVFASAGVNFSHVKGRALPPAATARRPELAGRPFQALGVSLVVHPHNPYVPTAHMNVRFFATDDAEDQTREPVWWFGGGFDLTPYYGFEEDCISWHQHAREACDYLQPDAYPRFKQWCDEYFFLKHRNEARGVGGIFFDDLNEPDFECCWRFVQAVGRKFGDAYFEIVERRKNTRYSQREIDFQRYRRGRYVEFNLVYDRGTLFGLQSGGRTESILMSMPPEVNWHYNWKPIKGSPEEQLYADFLPARDWLASS